MAGPVVATRFGAVRGLDGDGVLAFLGIPYAAPPVDELRFAPPAPPAPWSGVRDAREPGPVAPQPESVIGGYVPGDPREQDEGCLAVHVFTPGLDDARRPVMVFVHGGAFLIGTGGGVMYRADALARRGVVVVTFNYRLGALGFLAHRELRDGASGPFGNWGVLDQLAALEFVRDHASAFGGDPGNVTLFGESAGAMSAADLLAVPRARGLFHKAVLESGAAQAMTVDAAEANAHRFGDALGLGVDLDRLRKVPVEEILAAQRTLLGDLGVGASMPFQPVVDGRLLPDHPDRTLARGVPVDALLVGTNRDEFRFFTVGQRQLDEIDDIELGRLVEAYLPPDAPLGAAEVLARYRSAEPAGPRRLFEQVAADAVFWAPAARLADASAPRTPTFFYRFDWESPFLQGALGACHGLELPFVFGTIENPIISLFAGAGPEAARLADRMQSAWVAFATTGNPSTEELPWPEYGEERRTLLLGAEPSVVAAPRPQIRALWAELLGGYGEQPHALEAPRGT